MAAIEFTVNGKRRGVDTDASRPLLDVLREELGLTGTKYGCGEGQCRACTVLMNGRPVASCITPVKAAAGATIQTIEGLAANSALHPVQQAFLDEGAMQCGYCTPGMVLEAVSLLKSTPQPSEQAIVKAMNTHICRCNGYARIVAAVQAAARVKSSNAAREAGHAQGE